MSTTKARRFANDAYYQHILQATESAYRDADTLVAKTAGAGLVAVVAIAGAGSVGLVCVARRPKEGVIPAGIAIWQGGFSSNPDETG